jgi:hypothetical protein
MTVLAPGASDIDPQTERDVRGGRLRELIQLFFQQDPAGPSSSQTLPLRIDPEMWLHILSNSLGGYRGALANAPPRHVSSYSCRGSTPRDRRRRPDDQDDPEAEREGKRQCRPSDLTKDPKGKGKAREANQGDQQAPIGWFRSALDHIKGFWAHLTAPRATNNDPKTSYMVFWDDKSWRWYD